MQGAEVVVNGAAFVLFILLFQLSPLLGCLGAFFFAGGWWLGKALLLSIPGFLDLTPYLPFPWLRDDEARRRESSSRVPLPSGDKVSCEVCDSAACGRRDEGRIKEAPWEGLVLPEVVDTALQEFIDLTLKTYVHEWYIEEISDDPSFLLELRYQIRWLAASLLRCLQESSLAKDGPADWLLLKATPLTIAHAEVYSRVRRHLGGAKAGGAVLEERVLDFLRPTGALHRALYSRDAELAYLRRLADHLVRHLTDTSRLSGLLPANANGGDWAANPAIFLRELITFNFLLPVVDLLAEPDTLNLLLGILFDPSPILVSSDPPTPRVPLLAKLTHVAGTETSDSLVTVKLSEIMREPELLFAFMNYLKATKGPLHHLQFLLAAEELQERIRHFLHPQVSQDERADAGAEEEAASHLHFEAWEVYKNYVHEAAPDRLPLPPDIAQPLKQVVEGPAEGSPSRLEAPLLKAYQLVYAALQVEQVVPFCQSEAYLARLVGERPVLLNIAQLAVPRTVKLRGSLPSSPFPDF